MTSYEFEAKCKNALIKVLKEKYNEDYNIQDFHLVWFAKELQNYKCTICDLKPNQRYYECTYNGNNNELYIDIYNKEFNVKLTDDKLSGKVATKKKVGDLHCRDIDCAKCPLLHITCAGYISDTIRETFKKILKAHPELELIRPYIEKELDSEVE